MWRSASWRSTGSLEATDYRLRGGPVLSTTGNTHAADPPFDSRLVANDADRHHTACGKRAVEGGQIRIEHFLVIEARGGEILFDRLEHGARRVGRGEVGSARDVARAGADLAVQPDE